MENNFPKKKYDVIYADPPWEVDYLRSKGDEGKKFNDEKYTTMSVIEISNLPVVEITKENSALFLWTTNTFLPGGLDVMKSWGFKYHCCITWFKDNGITMRGFNRISEFLLFGYKGRFPEHICSGISFPTVIKARREEHSKKPDIFRELIGERFNGDRIELFARHRIIDWDAWGNQVPDKSIPIKRQTKVI